MKHAAHSAVGMIASMALPLMLVAGCPQAVEPLVGFEGTYWVEYVKGELVIYELPAERGADAMWYALAVESPAWYSGPGLYETNVDGTWSRQADGQVLSLDEIMQLHDPIPRPEEPEEETLPSLLAGLYWVEQGDGVLAMYKFPRYRDEEGRWREVAVESPAWYTGPGLYEADENFTWQRLSYDEDLTLDEILQLYDFRPRPPGDPVAGAPADG